VQSAESERIDNGRLRVLVLHNRYRSDAPSGENEVVDTEIDALRELGHEVASYQRSSDEIDSLPIRQRASLPIRALHSRRDVSAVLDLVATHRPDVVHVHNLNPLISPAVIPAVRRAGTPVIMTVHNFRLVCPNGLFFRDGAECRECVGHRFASPAVRHACYRGSRVQSISLAATLATHRDSYLSVDRFLAPSPSIATYLHRDLGVPANRVTVKPHTVPDPGQPTVPRSGGFVFIGRLAPSKGVSMLVDAWLRHPEGALGRLTIIGDGSERAAITQLVGDRRDVTMLGQVPAADVAAHIKEHSVVVVPSISVESFGRVIVEAMAHGRPVLTTRVGSLPEIVGDAGWVADPLPDDLGRALLAAAGSDPALASIRARARYEHAYAPAVVHRALVTTYREVAAARRDARDHPVT
jgi:glycosyltransferase involved in cell wall biosynthesis